MSLEKIKLNFNPKSNEQSPEERLKEIEEILIEFGWYNKPNVKKEQKKDAERREAVCELAHPVPHLLLKKSRAALFGAPEP